MIRRTTVFWFVLAAFCGTALFHTSQQVTDGREKLARLEGDIVREDESLRVLQAEWSYLNQPDRLEKMAREFLQLEPMTGRQFARLADIAPRPADGTPATMEKTAVAAAPVEIPHVVRIVKPVASVSTKPAAKPETRPERTAAAPAPSRAGAVPPSASKRDFGDVMKSLGVD